MTCRFLESLTLQSLIAPVPEAEFRSEYWQKKPLIVLREDPDYYGDLFTLKDFDEAIARTPEYVKVAEATTKKNTKITPGSASDMETILAEMRNGSTLILDGLHQSDPKLGMLCRLLGPQLGHRWQTNLYLTPPHGKGFTPHWDNHDVFILQTVGEKQWYIEKERRAVPLKDENIGGEGRELRGELDSFVLKQGDVIYIPRGYVHAAECGAEPSLHITLGLSALFMEHLLNAMVMAALRRDERLRDVLPIGFLTGDREPVVRRLKAVFRAMAEEAFLNEAVDQYRDEVIRTFPLDVSGQVLELYHPAPLGIEDVVAPRRGTVFRKTVGDDWVRLNVGARAITFPGFFREALDFALAAPSYAIGDIPGDLEDEERIVFVERLIQEGLVVRKESSQI